MAMTEANSEGMRTFIVTGLLDYSGIKAHDASYSAGHDTPPGFSPTQGKLVLLCLRSKAGRKVHMLKSALSNAFIASRQSTGAAGMIRLLTLFVVIAFGGSVACVMPGEAQILKNEPDPKQLSCGQKVLVENNTCPAGQILEVTGSCLDAKSTIDTMQRGIQYRCIKWKQE